MTSSRRRFLAALGASAAALPLIGMPAHASANLKSGNTLILIELSGGNDGLNTVVPITDPAYRALRPSIGLARDTTLRLDADTGLHEAMRAMGNIWDQGELQIIEGVGYPNPNRSHFRSIEIWNAGLGAETHTQTGWISTAFADASGPRSEIGDGLTLGGDMGPLRGPGRFSSMQEDPEGFLETLEQLPNRRHAVRPGLHSDVATGGQSPLDHVMATYESAKITGTKISQRLERAASRKLPFPETALGAQLQTAARLLEAGVDVPVFKVVQDGFDTHDDQPDIQAYLLEELSEAIGAFRNAMQDVGLWDKITVLTYSEFGRTARENASYGTDHGTAAPILVTGGRVRPGFSGARVSLDRLKDDDLVHTTDYRTVYGSVLQDLWQIESPEFVRKGQRILKRS